MNLFGNSLIQKIKKILSIGNQTAPPITIDDLKAKKKNSKLAFLLPGGHGFWYGMGQELYSSKNVFRESIQYMSKLSNNKFPLVEYFEGSNEDLVHDSNLPLNPIMQVVLQIALTELWLSEGVEPDCSIGCSLGEVTACYLSGALSVEDIFSLVETSENFDPGVVNNKQYKLINVPYRIDELGKLLQECPIRLGLCVEQGPSNMVVYCLAEEIEKLESYISAKTDEYSIYAGEFAYHTPLPQEYKNDLFTRTSKIVPHPFDLAHYSAFGAGKMPNGVLLDPSYWYWLYSSPARFNSALDAMLDDGCDTILFVGSNSFLGPQVEQNVLKRGKEVTILDSLTDKQSEVATFENSLKSLTDMGFARRKTYSSSKIGESYEERNSTVNDITKLSLLLPEFIHDPYPYYKFMRSKGSCHYLEEDDCWLVLNYEDVTSSLKKPELFSSKIDRGLDYVLACNDPPDHTKSRDALSPHFSARSLASLNEVVEEKARKLLEKVASESEFDLVENFSNPLTEEVIGHILGFSEEELCKVQEITRPSRYQLGYIGEMDKFLAEYLDSIDEKDSQCFSSKLLKEGQFKKEEVASLLKLLWVGGTTTTSILISSSVNILMRHHGVNFEVRKDLDLIPQFIEEVLRFDAPLPSVIRKTTQDIEFGEITVPAGSNIRFCLNAANRDPSHYHNPDLFDLNRNAKDHCSFGGGAHYCLGAMLSRIEARIALSVLIESFPVLCPSQSIQEEQFIHSDHFRGLVSLPVSTNSPLKDTITALNS